MRSLCCHALLVLSLIVMTGCATDGNHLPRRTGLLIEPGAAMELGYVLNWSTDLNMPGDHQLVAAKVLGDLLVTIEDPGNLVTAISIRDGSIKWRRVIGDSNKQLHAPARYEDQILVNTDHRLYLLAANDGVVEAIQDLGRVVAMGPTVVNGLAVFGSVDGTVFAHDLGVGYTEWEYQLTNGIITPPVAGDGDIFAADSNGTYVMLNQQGEAMWRGRTFDTISAAPAMDQTTVYVASQDRALYALNRNTGQDRWPAPYRATQPIELAPKSFDLVVLQPLAGQGVLALDSVDGTVRWRLEQTAVPIGAVDEDVILAQPRTLLRVELATGDLTAQAETLRLRTVLQGPDGSLILVSPGGRLLRMNPSR